MKKTLSCTLAILFAMTIFTSCENKYKNDTHKAMENNVPVVERYGSLQVIGTDLSDSKGNPVQIVGMSSHGLQWHGKYANEKVIRTLRDDWNCQLWRSAMYVSNGGYIGNPSLKNKVFESIEAAIKLGVYVIVDWHVLSDQDPLLYEKQAADFFTEVATKYGQNPNIIYEICNEPNGKDITWEKNIKPYAERIIKVIRSIDENNVIIVGTPNWSGDLYPVMKDPIVREKNIMYTLHFYAGSHGKERRTMVEKAVKSGLPVFITEWGTTRESGDGGVFKKQTLEWMNFCKKNNISWANWSVNNKGEDSGILKFNADRNAEGNWQEKDLSESGILLREILRNEVKK